MPPTLAPPPGPRPIADSPPQTRTRPPASQFVTRGRAYAFVLDPAGRPVELGSGRFAKAYLGVERWLESKTAFDRKVAIKILQRGVSEEDALRFQMEKELVERVQGHPNVVALFASGESDNPEFIPVAIRNVVENDFMILELCEMSLEERLKGTRRSSDQEDLLACPAKERLFRVLEYMLPVSAAVEYAHLIRNICHRDIKPANVLLKLPDPRLQGSVLEVRLADFNVGKVREESSDVSLTTVHAVPGTQFFQSPEQETNVAELLVNVEQGSPEVEYFENFYLAVAQNDRFQIFNRPEQYAVAGVDRVKKRILLATPFREFSERNIRAKVIKSVDRPADIYSLGAMLYYLVSGGCANPKSLYDAFHKFIEYEQDDEDNTVESYIEHEYEVITSLRAPRIENDRPAVAPVDRFFTYKQYLDGNGELIDKSVMLIVAKAMIRNKPDSYCQAWDVNTAGISDFVADLVRLYSGPAVEIPSRPTHLGRYSRMHGRSLAVRDMWRGLWNRLLSWRRRTKKAPRLKAGSKP